MKKRSHLRSTLAISAALMLVAALLVGTSSPASADHGQTYRVALPIAGGISESDNAMLINSGFNFGARPLLPDIGVCGSYQFHNVNRAVVLFTGHQTFTGSAHALQLKAHWESRPSATRLRFVGPGALAHCFSGGVEYSVYVVQAID